MQAELLQSNNFDFDLELHKIVFTYGGQLELDALDGWRRGGGGGASIAQRVSVTVIACRRLAEANDAIHNSQYTIHDTQAGMPDASMKKS